MSASTLNFLAKEYVNLTLCKSKYDYWDVYWYADKPYWKRESMVFSRDYKVYPYIEPGENREGKTLKDIFEESNHLISFLQLYKKTAKEEEMDRVNYLINHTKGLKTRTAVLLGEKISFNDMTEGCYNLVAPAFDYKKLDSILEELDNVLPGKGPLPLRIEDFRSKILVPREKLPKTLTAVTEAFHSFAVKNMDISKNNMPRLRFKDLGGKMEFLSILFGYDYNKIELERNLALDFPYTVDRIMEIIGHEMEPGHLTHYEFRLKTMIDKRYPEMSIIAQYSPSSAFWEGSARMAVYMCFDNNMKNFIDFERDLIFELGGLDKGLVDCMETWHKFMDIIGYGKLEVTRNRWDGVWSSEEGAQWMEEHMIVPSGTGKDLVDNLASDDGHFVAHDYARDVVKDYYKAVTKNTAEQWELYQKLCKSHMSIRGIKDHTYKIS